MNTMKNKDITFLQSELSRVSSWIEFADKKAGFLGIFYSAILAFLLTQHQEILKGFFYLEGWLLISYVITFSFLVVSLAYGLHYLFCAVLPNLKNGHTSKSLFYYGNVAQKKISDYLQEMSELSDDRIVHELTEQIYTNSVIADKKMACVRRTTRVLFVAVVALVIFALFI